MSEEILGSFIVDKIRSWIIGSSLPAKSYSLIFTPNRLIGEKISLFKFLKGDKSTVIMFDRISIGGQEKGSLESILKADKDNFEIPYSEIKRIEMKKASIADKLWSATRTEEIYAGKLEIYTFSKKYRFEISRRGQHFEECAKVVRSVLPEKLILK